MSGTLPDLSRPSWLGGHMVRPLDLYEVSWCQGVYCPSIPISRIDVRYQAAERLTHGAPTTRHGDVGRHPRLFVAARSEIVNGGPAPAMMVNAPSTSQAFRGLV
jgi:hypothetical protein